MKDLKLIDIHGVFPETGVPTHSSDGKVFTRISVPVPCADWC